MDEPIRESGPGRSRGAGAEEHVRHRRGPCQGSIPQPEPVDAAAAAKRVIVAAALEEVITPTVARAMIVAGGLRHV